MSAIREAILKAVVGCEHIIGVDKVELFYDDERPGKTALTQLADRIEAALSQQAPVSAEAGELPPILVQDRTIYALNERGENRWWAHIQPGRDDEDKRISDDECTAVALALAQSRAQAVPAEPVVSIDAAIQWIEDRRANYIGEHGYSDPDTGALEYGRGSHAQAKEEYVGELEEIIEGLRELRDDAAPAVSEPAETSVVNQSLTTAAAPSAPIEPTPVAAPETERVCMKTVCDDSCSYPHCMVDYPAAPAEPTPELTYALRDVAVERRRQIEREGWTLQHDDKHHDGAMSMAAAGYASEASEAILNAAHELDGPGEPSIHDVQGSQPDASIWPHGWTFKPATPRRMLVKAGALILAEIERLDRATTPAEQGEE